MKNRRLALLLASIAILAILGYGGYEWTRSRASRATPHGPDLGGRVRSLPVPPGLSRVWLGSRALPASEGSATVEFVRLLTPIAQGDNHSYTVCIERERLGGYLAAPDFLLDRRLAPGNPLTLFYPNAQNFHLHVIDAAGANLATVWASPAAHGAVQITIAPTAATILAVVPSYSREIRFTLPDAPHVPAQAPDFHPSDVTAFGLVGAGSLTHEAYALTTLRLAVALRAQPPADDTTFTLDQSPLAIRLGATLSRPDGTQDWLYVLSRPEPAAEEPPAPTASTLRVHVLRRAAATPFEFDLPPNPLVELDPPQPVERGTVRIRFPCPGQPHYLSLTAWPTGAHPDQYVHIADRIACTDTSGGAHEHTLSCEVSIPAPDPDNPPPPQIGSIVARVLPLHRGLP